MLYGFEKLDEKAPNIRNVYKIFVIEHGSKSSLERLKYRVFDNIKMNFEERVTCS
jgi:hypothetical protein